MKQFIIFILLLLPLLSFSQNSNIGAKNLRVKQKAKFLNEVTIGSSSFDASAILGITSTTKGLLIPRMTTAERDAIGSPSTGLMIYNTITNQFEFFETTWQAVGGAGVAGDSSFVVLQVDSINTFNNNTIAFDTITMVLDGANNRIGIGIATPAATLHVRGASGTDKILFLENLSGTDALIVKANGNTFLTPTDALSAKVRVSTIDISSSYSMAIKGIVAGADILRLYRGVNILNNGMVLGLGLLNSINVPTDYATIIGAIGNNTGDNVEATKNGNLRFTTATNGGMTEKMRIDKNGNVGIGLSSGISARLHIKGIDATSSNFAFKAQDNVGTDLFNVRNDGNVGIGVSSPTSILSLKMGTGTGVAEASGKANVNTTAAGTPASTAETDLITYSLPANSLSANGQLLRITVWGTTGANGNTKTIRLYFGGTVVRQIGPTAPNNQDWRIEAIVVRTGANTQDAFGFEMVDASNVFTTHSEPSDDTTGAITIKVTGENGTAASNDIVAEGLLVEYLN